MQAKGLWGFVLFVATVKETNFFKFFLELDFFLVGDVLKWGSVFAKVKADEFHNAFATHDIASEMAYHVYHVLGKVLQFASFFEVALLPSVYYAG